MKAQESKAVGHDFRHDQQQGVGAFHFLSLDSEFADTTFFKCLIKKTDLKKMITIQLKKSHANTHFYLKKNNTLWKKKHAFANKKTT